MGEQRTDLTRMTQKQLDYYNFIRAYIHEHKVSPSVYDVARHFGVYASSASRMIQKLDLRGFLHRPPDTRRTVVCKPLPKGHRVKIHRMSERMVKD